MVPVTAAIVAVIAAALAVLACRHIGRYLKFRAMELAIPGPPTLPLLGNALSFAGVKDGDVFNKIIELWDYRRGLSRVSILQNMVVFVNNAEDLEKLLKRKEFQDKAKFFYGLLPFARRSLPLLNGDEWKKKRRAMQPGFHKDVLEGFVDTFNQETKAFVKGVEPNKACEPLDDMFRIGSRAFFKIMLTDEIDEGFEELVVSIMRYSKVLLRDLSRRQIQPLLWPDFIYNMTAAARETQAMTGTIFEATKLVLDKRRAVLKDEPEHDLGFMVRKTILDILLAKDNKYPMNDTEVAEELMVTFGASVDSTTATQNFMLKILSLRPDLQEKIHAELTEVFGGTYRDVTAHDLTGLQYTERFIQETLRMYPPFPFVARQCWEETEFNGYKLPDMTTVVLNIFGAHRDPDQWPEPFVFDPDRFLPERSAGRHPNAYMPFSAGPRNCIGGRYAYITMKTFLANVIRAFRIEPVDDGITDITKLPITFDIAIRIVGGTWVKFAPRTDIKIDV